MTARRYGILDAMKAARDRAVRRLEALDFEVTAARRDVDDWNQRIASSERRRASIAARRHRTRK